MSMFWKINLALILIFFVLILLSPILITKSTFVDLGSCKIKETWSINNFTILSRVKNTLISKIIIDKKMGYPLNWVCVNENLGLIDSPRKKIFVRYKRSWLRTKIYTFEKELIKKFENSVKYKGKVNEVETFEVFFKDIREFIEIISRSENEDDVENFLKKFKDL